MNLENPVFLCGHRKGGTTMLLCLLDGHDELLVYPPDSSFFYAFYPLYASDEYSREQKMEQMISYCVDNLKYEIDRLTEEEQRDLNFSMERFTASFKKLAEATNMSPKSMLNSLLQAYREEFKGSINAKYWVEKTTSSEIYANEIRQWYPNAKFIHILRDPRDNWSSLLSGWKKRYQHFNDDNNRLKQSMIDRGRIGFEYALINQKIYGKENYFVCKYEDLVAEPEKYMKQVCEFLQIQYSESLLYPTVCGKFWPGNNFEGKVFKKPSSENVGRWKDRISKEDAALMEFHFKEVMEKFDYQFAFSEQEQAQAAMEHYKWFNFNQAYSQKTQATNA